MRKVREFRCPPRIVCSASDLVRVRVRVRVRPPRILCSASDLQSVARSK